MKNTIRITSGKYRGREISTPGVGTHPMGAREKLALFNMLTGVLPGARVLDAFAGSGALGIEAISRGAKLVVLVEKSTSAASIIKKNLTSLDLEGVTRVFAMDITNFQPDTKFDLILADPPYDNFDLNKILPLTNFMEQNAILALSHPGGSPEMPGLKLLKARQYAGATISIYQA